MEQVTVKLSSRSYEVRIGGGLLALGVSPVAIVGYAAVPSGLAAVLVLILAAIRRSRPIGHDVA